MKKSTFEEMVTKLVLNAILHHVGMSWIISSNDEIKYEMDQNNHQDWFNKGPWYNTSIYLKSHGSIFEDFITHARSDRYNLMCYLVAYDKKLPVYEDDEISIEYRSIPKNKTTKTLKSLGDNINFIDIWIKLFDKNYGARHVAYITATEDMFNQITLTMIKALTPKQNVQKLMTDIGGGWYMKKEC